MEYFTIGWPRSRVLNGFRRSPLIRISDRVESIMAILGVLMVIVALPVGAAVGTSVRDAQARVLAEHAATLSEVDALVTAKSKSRSDGPYDVVYATPVRWMTGGIDHTGVVESSSPLRVGDHLPVWLSESGQVTRGPAPVDEAARQGIAAAIVVWMSVASVVGCVYWALRCHLDIVRYRWWEKELGPVIDDGSRR
jgi:hypothetical protein